MEVRDVPAVSVAIDMLGALQATKVRANANAAADVAKKFLRGGQARPSQPANKHGPAARRILRMGPPTWRSPPSGAAPRPTSAPPPDYGRGGRAR